MAGKQELSGPDLAAGIALNELADGAMLQGHAAGEPVLVARRGDAYFAIGANCTHYNGPLAEGLMVGDTVRCPWHHACFDLRTGEAIRAPALNPVPCWRVEKRDGKLVVQERIKPGERRMAGEARTPDTVVIIGGGGAGNAAAEMLRREGHSGRIVMISADESVPYDRPNLSKDYLAGTAPEEWIPLRSEKFYKKHDIELLLKTRATAIDTRGKQVTLSDGSARAYDALVLATGGEPVRLDLPGADRPHVHYLRSLDDCRAIIRAAGQATRAVVVGASFIGMEVAAALRVRDLEVHVVAPGKRPMERVLGPEMGDHIRKLHEGRGVRFHLEQTLAAIDDRSVTLQNGETIEADLVIVGIGVRPVTEIAEQAGIRTDRGILVNEYLETSAPGVFAIGDIARWPDPLTGDRIRVEHWVVAERQGQTAAKNILGRRERFDIPPFFWTQHYDTSVNYVGYAERWDRIAIDGRIEDGDCRLAYERDGKTLAVVTIGRDKESLEAEVAMENRVART
ncbi:FAD-dependent oxidoreductase [Rhodospirillaceae bacterium SYSU D60014]|uniref:FAD-dependent oxidoreductase n=1 Tax=Virgifigura deserti TaxID=2268457 RepID=UPI000E66A828